MRTLPGEVQPVVDGYLTAVDTLLPSLVEGLYIVGSIALDDFRPHRSDIDFVAVTTRRLTTAELAALQQVHRQLTKRWRRPLFDGLYVTWSDLAADPSSLHLCASTHAGRFQPTGQGDIIAWHTLAQHGWRCRGPAVSDLKVWTDTTRLTAWTTNNLDTYWRRRVLDRSTGYLAAYKLASLSNWACEWCVTGVSRLHYTLATGATTSKHSAGAYALTTFDARWSRVIEEALRIRGGAGERPLYRSPLSRRREVRAFTEMVIDDARRLPTELGFVG